MSLQDKIAVVTGAASGIGKNIAKLFLESGAKVAIADLNLQAAEATARELDPTGQRAIAVAMDVTDEAQVDAGIAVIAAKFGGIDILISMPASRSWVPLKATTLPHGRKCSRSISTVLF